MTNKKQINVEKLVNSGINTLRRMDIQRGLIDENFEPFNGRLSAKENERCWECLAKHFVKNTLFSYLMFEVPLSGGELFKLWLRFLQDVNNVVKCGDRDGTIERVINDSGIPEETWVRFLD